MKKKSKAVNKLNVIPNLIWNLPRKVVSQCQQRRAWKTLNQVQGDDLVCYNYNNAFTLIELLVVVLIIGILAAVAVPQYQKAVYKSRYATLKNLVNSISQAEEVYYLANNSYATDFEELAIEMPAGKLDTSTKTKYDYNWGYCSVSTGMGDTIILCYNLQIGMQYQISLEHSATPGRRCTVIGSLDLSDIRNQICKSETGKNKYDQSWSGGGHAHWWY